MPARERYCIDRNVFALILRPYNLEQKGPPFQHLVVNEEAITKSCSIFYHYMWLIAREILPKYAISA